MLRPVCNVSQIPVGRNDKAKALAERKPGSDIKEMLCLECCLCVIGTIPSQHGGSSLQSAITEQLRLNSIAHCPIWRKSAHWQMGDSRDRGLLTVIPMVGQWLFGPNLAEHNVLLVVKAASIVTIPRSALGRLGAVFDSVPNDRDLRQATRGLLSRLGHCTRHLEHCSIRHDKLSVSQKQRPGYITWTSNVGMTECSIVSRVLF